MTLPNELLFGVASHLDHFRDLNSLLRTSRFFYTLFNTQLYCRAVDADDTVREEIVNCVLLEQPIASVTPLLNNGLSVHQKLCSRSNSHSEDLLRWICMSYDQERSVELAQLLIERGADIEAKDADASFHTVLYLAIHLENNRLVALLLAHGADATLANQQGWTPLHTACLCNEGEAVKLLIVHGAIVDASNDGTIPLLLAISRGKMDIVPALLAHGADACARENVGATPLHWAFAYADREVAKLLLEHGADVNAIDDVGQTPLHWMHSPFLSRAELRDSDDRFFIAMSKAGWRKWKKIMRTRWNQYL
jgi:hypothetical protein